MMRFATPACTTAIGNPPMVIDAERGCVVGPTTTFTPAGESLVMIHAAPLADDQVQPGVPLPAIAALPPAAVNSSARGAMISLHPLSCAAARLCSVEAVTVIAISI